MAAARSLAWRHQLAGLRIEWRQAGHINRHLAGRLGVALADALVANGSPDGGEVTDSGMELLRKFGTDLSAKPGRRIFCRPCLDWSERRYHLAGRVGAAICRHCLDIGWLTRERDTRAVHITAAGRRGLRNTFGVEF